LKNLKNNEKKKAKLINIILSRCSLDFYVPGELFFSLAFLPVEKLKKIAEEIK